jgi:nucleoside-triphosphatase THEP1
MSVLKKNIFLTGPPSSGKTTVIKRLVPRLPMPAGGFYTEEEKEGDRRVGFVMRTLDGREGYLAHREIRSEFRIRRYGVSIENIETIAVPAIEPGEGRIIVLDEIGKMECFSAAFRSAAAGALGAVNIVIGTITLGGDDFIAGVKARPDVEILEVTPENRDALPDLILRKVAALLAAGGKTPGR